MKKFLLTATALVLFAIPASAKTYKFRIHNDTGLPFIGIYIVAVDTDGWGRNLAKTPIRPGKYRTFIVNSCHVNFRMDLPGDDGGSIGDYNVCAEPDFYFSASDSFGD